MTSKERNSTANAKWKVTVLNFRFPAHGATSAETGRDGRRYRTSQSEQGGRVIRLERRETKEEKAEGLTCLACCRRVGVALVWRGTLRLVPGKRLF
jgi:hypothetical protein